MSKNCGIYDIKNVINGKKYIGQSTNLKRRKREHFSDLRRNKHYNKDLQDDFNEFGEKNFRFEKILICEPDDLTYYENFFIKYYNSKFTGYNINDAATPPDNRGKRNGMYGKIPANRRLDIDNNIEQLLEMFYGDFTYTEIGDHFKCDRTTVDRRLREELGESYDSLKEEKNRKISDATLLRKKGIKDEDILKLARSGLTGVQIGQKLGCSAQTVTRKLRKLMSEEEYSEVVHNNRAKVSSEKNSRYTLWDSSKMRYRSGRAGNICFYLKYNYKEVGINGFHDFVTVGMLYDLIEWCLK